MALQADLKKQRKTLAIIQAAEEIFFKKPYSSITVDEIALAAGVTKKTLYTYFPSKLALFMHMFEYYLQQLHRKLLEAVDREPRPDRYILEVSRILFTFTWENEKFMRFFWSMDSAEFDGETPRELIQSVRSQNRQLIDMVADLVRKGQDQGIIRQDIDAELLVHIISAVNKGILIHTNKEAKFNVAKIDPEYMYTQCLRLITPGLFDTARDETAAAAEGGAKGPKKKASKRR
jgi:AcrR family transcriptional regulator